jgi:hypothetical protein
LVELEPELPELEELEPEELEPDVPEVPEVLPLDELADFDGLVLVEAVLAEPGSASATAPAASTLATPTVAVVVTTRPLARRRAATPRVTVSRFGLFMVEASLMRLGGFSTELLSWL